MAGEGQVKSMVMAWHEGLHHAGLQAIMWLRASSGHSHCLMETGQVIGHAASCHPRNWTMGEKATKYIMQLLILAVPAQYSCITAIPCSLHVYIHYSLLVLFKQFVSVESTLMSSGFTAVLRAFLDHADSPDNEANVVCKLISVLLSFIYQK